MKIIIAGCGKVGYILAEQLNEEGHEITIIDTNEEKINMVGNLLDVMCIQGNATSYHVQEEAGVKEADLLIAVTNKDEVNLLCCLIARKAGHCQTIARVRDPGYYAEIGFIKEELGLSMAINPELAAAADIARLIQIPSAMEVDTFAKGKVDLVRFRIPKGSAWGGKKIIDASKKVGGNLLICVIERENHQVLIPDGNVVLHEGDYAYYDLGGVSVGKLLECKMDPNERIIKVAPAPHTSLGGIVIDTECHALGRDGKPVSGIYACGEVTAGVHGFNRLGGNGGTAAMIFGTIAGRQAVAEMKKYY